jgi:ATP-dependent 26S proteasome regulatory subunit
MSNGKIERTPPTVADYIQAGYPCLYLRTSEPQVAEKKVQDALDELNMSNVELGVWKATTGLMVGPPSAEEEHRTQAAGDLIDALKYVQNKDDRPVVAMFHNLRKMVDNYQVVQSLIDTIMTVRLRGSHVFIIGPHLELPPELRTLVTVYDIALPTQDELVEGFRKIVRAYEDDIDLPEEKDDLDHLLVDAARAAVGLDMIGAENAIALSIATAFSLDVDVIHAQKEQEVKKSDVLEFWPHRETLENVGGFHYYKQWLSRRQKAFTHEAREFGLPYPKGVLIVGPAGTGKSLTAKATARYLGLPLLRLDMGKIFRSLVGESESAVRMALKVAEAVSPVVLWVDEIEKGLAGAQASGQLDSGVTARVVSTLLTWRQETTYPVVLCCTANDVSSVPSMVYRKGRLDEVWCTDLPTHNERREIFEIHIRKRKRDPEDFNLDALAEATPDYTGAEIEGVIEDAMFAAFDQDDELDTKHILDSIRETVAQATRDKEELTSIREWCKTRARSVSKGDPPKTKAAAKVRHLKPKRQSD